MTDKISIAEALKETKTQYGEALKKLASGQDDEDDDENDSQTNEKSG